MVHIYICIWSTRNTNWFPLNLFISNCNVIALIEHIVEAVPAIKVLDCPTGFPFACVYVCVYAYLITKLKFDLFYIEVSTLRSISGK